MHFDLITDRVVTIGVLLGRARDFESLRFSSIHKRTWRAVLTPMGLPRSLSPASSRLGILDKVYGTNTAFTSWIEELTRRESNDGARGPSKGDVVSKARKELARKEDAGETFVPSVL